VISLGVIIMALTSSGIAGFIPSPSHNTCERGVPFPPLVKGGFGGVVPAESITRLPKSVLAARKGGETAGVHDAIMCRAVKELSDPPLWFARPRCEERECHSRSPRCASPPPLTPPSQGGERSALRPQHFPGWLHPIRLGSKYLFRTQPVSIGLVKIFGISQRDFDSTESPIKDALRDGKYPWYDSRSDRLQPVWPIRVSWLERLGERIASIFRRIAKFFDRFHFGGSGAASAVGNSIGTILLLAAFVAFFVGVFMLWVRREGGAVRCETERIRLGAAAQLGDLLGGMRPEDADPWAEAQRRRAAGDLAGSVVCLFAHQLLTLDRMGLIQLAPGRTGRHYLQSLRDRELTDALGSTLRLFEDVYYGRKSPTTQAFESVWSRALLFQERQRALGVSVSP
jgi:hypothetical protein